MPDPPRQLPDILNIKTSFYFFTPVSCHFSLSIAYLPSCPRNISGLKNLQGQNQTTFSHYTIIYFFRIANHFFRKKLFRSKKLPYFCIFCIKNHSCPIKIQTKEKISSARRGGCQPARSGRAAVVQGNRLAPACTRVLAEEPGASRKGRVREGIYARRNAGAI